SMPSGIFRLIRCLDNDDISEDGLDKFLLPLSVQLRPQKGAKETYPSHLPRKFLLPLSVQLRPQLPQILDISKERFFVQMRLLVRSAQFLQLPEDLLLYFSVFPIPLPQFF